MLLGAAADRLLVGHRRVAGRRPTGSGGCAAGRARSADARRPGPTAPSRAVSAFCSSSRVGSSSISLAIDAGQLDVVAALLGVDRQAVDRLRLLRLRQRLGLAGRGQHRAGRDLLHPGQPDDLAQSGRTATFSCCAPSRRTTPATRAAVQHVAFGDRAAPDARQRQLAGMRQVIGLEHLRQRLALRRDAEPRRGLLPAPASRGAAPSTAGARRNPARAEPRNTGTIRFFCKILGQVLVDLLLRGLHVFEQLLEQLVVEIGELFDEAGAGVALPGPRTRRAAGSGRRPGPGR